MTATKPQSKIEQFLAEESESLSQLLYNKPFSELDEVRQARIKGSARKALKNQIFYEPQKGECFSCGQETVQDSYQCWHCHESRTPSPKQAWLESHRNEVQR